MSTTTIKAKLAAYKKEASVPADQLDQELAFELGFMKAAAALKLDAKEYAHMYQLACEKLAAAKTK
jgi:hypothetical protein